MSENGDRDKIIDQIKEHREQLIKGELKPFWLRTCEDLIAGGVPREKVGESIFGASITLTVQIMGFADCAAHLRDIANLVERAGSAIAGSSPSRH